MSVRTHIAILGAGPGGCVAPIRAAQLGARVTEIESQVLGGKVQATGETTGWCKVVADASSGKVLGVDMIGAHAADLIHEAALAMQVGVTGTQVAEMIHAHPTLAEGFMEAAEDVEGRAIHQVRKKVG
jgi:dihydrolipoamide dehydrogenase